MVKGLDIFREYFARHSGRYVLIGGTAATLAMQDAGLEFRATKDLDIVLHVESLNADFARTFWEFIAAGQYEIRQASSGKPVFYRFQKPAIANFPVMLELFSRSHAVLDSTEGRHLTPIPIEEDVSSLSAILLDDDYYHFVMAHRRESDGLSWVSAECLIALKAHACSDLSARKLRGEAVDSKSITKHRNDVVRLSQLLTPSTRIQLPSRIRDHLTDFLDRLSVDASFNPKSIGLQNSRVEIVSRLDRAFIAAD